MKGAGEQSEEAGVSSCSSGHSVMNKLHRLSALATFQLHCFCSICASTLSPRKSSGWTRGCLGCPAVAKPLIVLEITPPSSSPVPWSLISVHDSLDRGALYSLRLFRPFFHHRCPFSAADEHSRHCLPQIMSTEANGSWRHRRLAFITNKLEMQAQPVAREQQVAVRSGLKREPLPTI